MRTTRRTSALLLAGALVAAGCGADDPDPTDTAAPSPTDTSAPSPTDTAAPSPTDTAAPSPEPSTPPAVDPTDLALPALDTRCEVEPALPEVAAVSWSVPSSWQVDGSCEFLDPSVTELPAEQEAEVAVLVDVTTAAYGDVVAPGPATTDESRWVGARAGFQQLRRTATSTGAALAPEGRPVTSWYVDLDAGTDVQGGVLTVSTGTVGEGRTPYRLAQGVADLIADTVVVEPPAEQPGTAPGDTEFTVTREEGGGAPYAVTFDGACFRLRPGGPTADATDELCTLDPTQGELVAGTLGTDVVVGHAPPGTSVVTGDDTPAGAIAASIEGGTVFAVRTDADPSALEAVGPGGTDPVVVPR